MNNTPCIGYFWRECYIRDSADKLCEKAIDFNKDREEYKNYI